MEVLSPFEVFAKTFPAVVDAYRQMKKTYGAAGPLDGKTQQLIQVAVMVAIGSESGTKDHVTFALDAGATPDEVRQAVLMVLGPAGMSATSAGLMWTNEALSAREASG